MTEADLVLIERLGRRADIILNRPERRNAVTGPMAQALRGAVEQLSQDNSVGAIVLRGAGSAFCSGLDLKEFRAEPKPAWVAGFSDDWRAVHTALFNCKKPLIGALERFAINGGAALALACDLLVVGESAFLQVGEIQMSSAAPMNLAWLRMRHSEAVSAKVVLLGERIGAAELFRLGIASHVAPDEDVVANAHALADVIASYPPGAAEKLKSGFRRLGTSGDPALWFGGDDAAPGALVSSQVLPARSTRQGT